MNELLLEWHTYTHLRKLPLLADRCHLPSPTTNWIETSSGPVRAAGKLGLPRQIFPAA